MLYLMLTCVAIYNSWCYLYKARLGSHLVILFYILTVIIAVCNSLCFFILALNPTFYIQMDRYGSRMVTDVIESISGNFVPALYWLVAATMIHLLISIRVIFKLMTPEQARVAKRRVSITATIILVIQMGFVLLTTLYYFEIETTKQNYTKILIVIGSILVICYVLIIVFLHRTLKKMNEFGDFNKAQKSVICQFAFFLVGSIIYVLI